MMQLNAMRWRLEVLAVRHGLWMLPGAVLLLGALLAWGWWLPSQEAALRETLSMQANEQPSTRTQAAQASAPHGAPHSALPPAARADAAMQRLFALAAEHGLTIAQADYRRQETGRVGRWQVQMPATGTYPQVRRFLRAAQAIPGLSLDELGIHRAPVGAGIEARLLFSVWFTVQAPAERAS
ncbi:type II secretion system protein GspM [Massilia scottii]|uniref:type II secretion system protein GspM n=1 Tax=Massilia scottii TaxID=3057166 RepID=UPI002796BC32|nr:type II secretion system protein GspM [Massilia sp. CCM 9029]MDQ1834295.1 type II secretion system protein GspM [Massilia sp. CCM 9029]